MAGYDGAEEEAVRLPGDEEPDSGPVPAGFEPRKDEFPSFVGFVTARTEKNERVGRMTE